MKSMSNSLINKFNANKKPFIVAEISANHSGSLKNAIHLIRKAHLAGASAVKIQTFSPDCMTGLEANLRFAGPETMETKIFGRLTAWQNWIFQRPNAVGEEGALKKYGSGNRRKFNWERV